MMCRSVLADKAGTVETKHYRQVEDSQIVDDIVVGALSKSTVDIAERQQTVLGHAAGERHGMTFGDTHVKDTVRHLLHHDVHRATRRHGGSHTNNLGIAPCQLQQRMAKDFLKLWRLVARVGYDTLARFRIEAAGSMPNGGRLLGRLVTFAFDRVEMQQLGAPHILELAHDPHHFLDVVSVKGSEVADVHAFKDILLMADSTLQGIVEPDDAFPPVVVEIALGVEPLRCFEAQTVVSFVGVEVEQIFLHAANSMVDAHIVVVENNQQIIGRGADIVQSFKSQSATHGTVADDGYDMPLGMSSLACSHRHAQCRRDAVRRMATGEGVVRTLFRRGERTHTTHLAVGAERVSSARQNLMAVGLMTHIPYDTVFGCIKDIVQCHGDLHHTKTGSEMSGVD